MPLLVELVALFSKGDSINGHLAVLRSNSPILKDTQLARTCVTQMLRQIFDIENSLKHLLASCLPFPPTPRLPRVGRLKMSN
jgi:hypothetical protein